MNIATIKEKFSNRAAYIAFASIFAIFALILVLSQNWNSSRETTGVSIRNAKYIDHSELTSLLTSYIGLKKEEVDLFEVENRICKHPFVESCIAKFTPNKGLIVKVTEKQVVAYCSFGNGPLMLMDSKGEYLPYKLYEGFQYLPLVTGMSLKIDLKYKKEAVKIINELLMKENESVLAEVSELHFNSEISGFKLFMSNSDTELIIGNSRKISEKLENFKIFTSHSIYSEKYANTAYIDLRWSNKVIVKKS